MRQLAKTPKPPYFAVIFTSQRAAINDEEDQAYAKMAEAMEALAAQQSGYLGIESVRASDGLGLTVSYWQDAASIAAWKSNAEHQVAQQHGRSKWYQAYRLRIARVEHEYGYTAEA